MALIRPPQPPASPAACAQSWAEQLVQGSAAERRAAARALGEQPGNSTLLLQQLNEECDSSVIEALITALALQADEPAVLALLDCLRSEDAMLRNEAVVALKSAGRQHPQLLLSALHDSDPDVRILTVNILESLQLPQVESWLIELISHDSQINVCACAIDLLCEVASEQALPALLQCRERFAGEDYLVFAIDIALRRLGEVPSES